MKDYQMYIGHSREQRADDLIVPRTDSDLHNGDGGSREPSENALSCLSPSRGRE